MEMTAEREDGWEGGGPGRPQLDPSVSKNKAGMRSFSRHQLRSQAVRTGMETRPQSPGRVQGLPGLPVPLAGFPPPRAPSPTPPVSASPRSSQQRWTDLYGSRGPSRKDQRPQVTLSAPTPAQGGEPGESCHQRPRERPGPGAPDSPAAGFPQRWLGAATPR